MGGALGAELIVGETEGIPDGKNDPVGLSLLSLGDTLGESVGKVLGEALGKALGDPLGLSLGSSDGPYDGE